MPAQLFRGDEILRHVMSLEKIISLESRHAQRKAKLVMRDRPLAVELNKRSFLRLDIEVCHVPPKLLFDGGR